MNRRRALMGQAKGRLPAGYQEVAWIKPNAGCYILTSELYGPNTLIYFKYLPYRWYDSRSYTFVFAVKSFPDGYTIGTYVNEWQNQIRWYSHNNDYIIPIDSLDELTVICGKGYLRVVGYGDGVGWDSQKNLSSNNPIAAFGKYALDGTVSSGLDSDYAQFRLTAFDISQSDVKTLSLVPCIRTSENKPGMYDLCGSICPLTGTPFYINAGTGEFTAGPAV